MPDPVAPNPAGPAASSSWKAGQYLFMEGERHGSLFVIESGEVELLRTQAAGPASVARVGPGDVIGEDCAFGGRASHYSARATTDATAIKVAADVLPDLVRLRPEIASGLIVSVGRKLLEARMARPPAAVPASAAPSPVDRTPPRDVPAPSASATARFVHEESRSTFPLPAESEAVVGRADPRSTTRPDLDLSGIDSGRTLSRRHARVSRRGAQFFLQEEPRVANGTFVNGRRLEPGVEVPIRDGDDVCFGLVRTIFKTT